MQRTLDEIKDLHATLDTHLRQFHSNCRTEDTYYNLEFEVETSEDAIAIKLPTAQDAIDDAAAQVDTTNITVHVPPSTPTYGGDVQAGKRRKYLLGCWHLARQYNGLVLHHAAKLGFLYGMGITTMRANPGAGFEIPIRAVNPQTFFPDPAKRFVVESYQRKAIEVRAEYPEAEIFGQDEQDGTWREYWDDEHCLYSFDDVVVVDMEHGYGFLPYFWGDSGLGYISDDNAPEDLYRGLLYDVHDLLIAESRLFCQGESILKQHAYPEKEFIAEVLTKAQNVQNKWEEGPGRSNAHTPEVEVRRVRPESPPPEILQLQAVCQDILSASTVPRVTKGERPVGASSGYMTAILSGMARIKFGGVVVMITNIIQEMNEGFLKLVENVFGEMTVFANTSAGERFIETIAAEDIEGQYVNFADISAIPVEEQERTLMLGSRLYSQKQISRRYWVINYLKPTDPQAEMDQQLLDEMFQDPMFRQMLYARAFETYDASSMLKEVGAGKAENQLLGEQGAAMPPMAGEYMESDRGPGRPVRPGSIEEMSQVVRSQGGEGMGRHVLDAYRAVVDKVKGENG